VADAADQIAAAALRDVPFDALRSERGPCEQEAAEQ
jgi:hypothetical protein